MDAPYGDRVASLVQEALEHPNDRRAAFLAEACAGEAGLLRDLEALPAADARPHSLLDGGAQAAFAASGPGLPDGTRSGPWRGSPWSTWTGGPSTRGATSGGSRWRPASGSSSRSATRCATPTDASSSTGTWSRYTSWSARTAPVAPG